tara:strand:+ start:50 stop:361 length:312 start_codon:yes stop_codon:yes gene_type:complete
MVKNQINNEKILQELEELFCSNTVEHFYIKGKDYFNIVIEARERDDSQRGNSNGCFRMTSIHGYNMRELDRIIDGVMYINSIDTTWYKDKLKTEILIVEGFRN